MIFQEVNGLGRSENSPTCKIFSMSGGEGRGGEGGGE